MVCARNRRDLNMLYGQGRHELGHQDWLLSSSIGGGFYMALADYAPHLDSAQKVLHQHTGEQHGLVVEGELELQIGDDTITLQAGDSCSFPADIPHQAVNRSSKPCKLVWAVAPVVIPSQVEVAHYGKKP